MAFIAKTLAPYTVDSGARVRLSDAQQATRRHVPATEDAGGWQVYSQPLVFKAGEEIELDARPPKGAPLEIVGYVAEEVLAEDVVITEGDLVDAPEPSFSDELLSALGTPHRTEPLTEPEPAAKPRKRGK